MISDSLKQRITTAFLFGIPTLFLVFFNDTTRLIFLGLVCLLAAWEFLNLNYGSVKNKFVFIVPALLMTLYALMYGLGADHLLTGVSLPYNLILIVSVVFNLVLLADLFFLKKVILTKVSWITSLLYTSIPLCLLMYSSQSDLLKALLIGILLLIWISDVGAYFSGKNFGKIKLMPSISPGKTWAGFVGAGILSAVGGYLMYLNLGTFSVVNWLIISILVWLFGSAGDLVESQLKRKLQIKDSGNILPGHGGILDRFDGFYFCIPFVLAYIYYIQQ